MLFRSPTCRKDYIGDALVYACQYWTKHLLCIPSDSLCVQEVQEAIDQFFKTHLLHWIEVLVLMEKLSVGIHAINDVNQWCTKVSVVLISS